MHAELWYCSIRIYKTKACTATISNRNSHMNKRIGFWLAFWLSGMQNIPTSESTLSSERSTSWILGVELPFEKWEGFNESRSPTPLTLLSGSSSSPRLRFLCWPFLSGFSLSRTRLLQNGSRISAKKARGMTLTSHDHAANCRGIDNLQLGSRVY